MEYTILLGLSTYNATVMKARLNTTTVKPCKMKDLRMLCQTARVHLNGKD